MRGEIQVSKIGYPKRKWNKIIIIIQPLEIRFLRMN